MVEIKITDNMPISGMKIRDISDFVSSSILIGAVLREDEAIIPKGIFRLKPAILLTLSGNLQV
ncbi:TrkA C-terminal domain-containing protein [Thermoclostridium stercorarium]|uniref:TrkA C-terminal domain-containing protein n=1 Tax=Thermoclostridium stercorarium TaxID=1510 RepID=UPI000B113125|nr:TrkA C-terminal domain-containing protein [Thermoclostridium stercorarium]